MKEPARRPSCSSSSRSWPYTDMEDRVINHLEKEHSHRFRTMCHKNANLAQESKIRLDFLDREKRKSLHSIALDQAELKGRMIQFSQERYVNGLLNQLTDLTFQSTDAESLSDVNPSLTDATSNESNLSVGPRYLRMETNAFHPSEMSLGSEDLVQCSSSIITKESLSSVVDEKQASDNPKNTISSSTVDNVGKATSAKGTASEEELKKVVDKLTNRYDIEKLKMLTQVMLKTLQKNDRFRYEDKMKLVYNLSRYFNKEADNAAEKTTPKSSNQDLKEDNTFLYLKADRQRELRDDVKPVKPLKTAKKNLFGYESRRSSVPSLPDINKISSSSNTSLLNKQDLRRHSLLSDWRTSVQSLSPDNRNTNQLSSSTALLNSENSPDPVKIEDLSDELDDMMKIYLRLGLGHGALLKLPRSSNRAAVKEKQKSWLRRDLRAKSTMPTTGVQDLRIVMKNCRYLRFPKDMIEHLLV
ncbi:uncharacterized protein LOC134813993 isoform X2 [Bolinopsis microptera]|uniref:uncharacterized protein LOC134813993 isoform X2 n=1 Tax=Bolinopsis microptera TaxID=2820187 RepID=UPI00307983A0